MSFGFCLTLCSCGPIGLLPLAGLAAVGVGVDDDEEPPPAFTVVSICPANAETDVDIYSPVTIVFSDSVDRATVTAPTLSVGGYAGSYYFYDNDTRVVFTPSSAYPMWTDITVTVSGVRCMSNPALIITGYTSTFRTGGASTEPPYIVSVVPPDGSYVPFAPYLPARVLFSKPMNTATITTATFYVHHKTGVTDLNGSISWDAGFREFVFTPSDSLVAGDEYEIRVLSTVESSDGYQMGVNETKTFTVVDLKPVSVTVPASAANPAGYINAATVNSVAVRVRVNANVCAGDTVNVNLWDGANNTWMDKVMDTDGPANILLTGIDASGLNDGSITLEARVYRGGFPSELTTGSAGKDTVVPSISIVKPVVAPPGQLPLYYQLRMLEVDISVDSAGTLHLTGGHNNQSASVTAGTHQTDYELNVASRNDIDIYATDDAGNESNHISQTIYHRGGASGGPISGTLRVSVYRNSSLTPVANAMVVCGYSTEVRYTDAEGVAMFSGVSGPQAVTVIHAGYPIFTILDVDAQRVSLPLLDDIEDGGPQFATVRGSVSLAPTNGFFYATHTLDWDSEDTNITGDGDYAVHVKPNRFYSLSAIDNSGGAFSNFIMKSNLGPLSDAESAIEDLFFSGVAPPATRLASGNVTLPDGFYLPAALLWERGTCFIMSRARAESDWFLCGYGVFPLIPVTGGPFAYSSIQPGYYSSPSGEYWMVLNLQDVYGREIAAVKTFNDGDGLPDFVFPDLPVLNKPGTGGVLTSLAPTFDWSDSCISGLHTLQITNTQNGNMWIIACAGGVWNATLPRIPDYAPVKVMEFSDDPVTNPAVKMLWRMESMYVPAPFDFNDFSMSEVELATEFRTQSRWREFNLWNPPDTGGRVPKYGVAQKPAGTMTVTVVEMETELPVPGVTVFLGDDPAGAQLTDALGQVVFNGVTGPVKLTVCAHITVPFPVDLMETFDQFEGAYATVPLIGDMDGEEFQLYGEVVNLPTGNDGWVTGSEYRDASFTVSDDSSSGLFDDFGHAPYDGPSPENFSITCRDRGEPFVVTGFYGPGGADNMFDFAYFSEMFMVAPYDMAFYKKLPQDIDYNASSGAAFSPIRRSTSPSKLWMPSNVDLGGLAYVTQEGAEPRGISKNNPWGEPATVVLGHGDVQNSGLNPHDYDYGFTFAGPPNTMSFKIDTLQLELGASGYNGDNPTPDLDSRWDSHTGLYNLAAYPSVYDTTLPDVPYPISPTHEQTGTGLPVTITWMNSQGGKQGIYMLLLERMSFPEPFAWILMVPVQEMDPATVTFPTPPAGFARPELGREMRYQIQSTIVPGYDPSSWCGDVFDEFKQGGAEWKDGRFTP